MSHSPEELGDLLRDALPTYEAPAALKAFAREHMPRELGPASAFPRRERSWLLVAASLIVTFAAGWWGHDLLATRSRAAGQDALTVAVVDTHVRSLMSGHLMDVRSSDQHTVKPWFAGKVPLAPSVPELSANGFPLLGGRVESVAGRPAAALVYGKARHVITLFIWTTDEANHAAALSIYHGYSVVHWTRAGLAYWASSDVAAKDLEDFTARYATSSGQPYP